MAPKNRIELNDFDEILNDERYKIDKDKKESKKKNKERRRIIDEYNKEEILGKAEKKQKATITGLIVAGSLVLTLFISIIVISAILNKGEVYAGIYFNDHSLYGMTKNEVEEFVTKTYIDPFKSKKLNISYEGKLVETTLYEVTNTPNAKKIAEDAYNVARKGNIFSRLTKVMSLKSNPIKMEFQLSLNKEILEENINALKDPVYTPKEDPSYTILPNSVTFRGGKNGSEINQEKVESDINEAIYELLETKNGNNVANVIVEVKTIKFTPLNADEIFDKVYVEPVDATFEKISRTEVVISDSIDGRIIDKDALIQLVSRINNGENIIFEELPIVDKKPEVSREHLEKNLMTYPISSASNKNNSNDDITDPSRMDERATNIEKCVSTLNGIILLPGEEFNFWNELGVFNESVGYVIAYDNSPGADTKVLGGGISQVASALYLAALTSELDITEHHNYPYMVNYGPLGFDAHVVKGTKNLVFKNTLEFPIKLSFSFENDTINVQILGTDTNSNTRIQTNTTSKPISYTTEYVDDPNLPEGTELITKGGVMGYEVKLYKRTIINGTELLNELIGTVIYEPRNLIITRGTGTTNEE